MSTLHVLRTTGYYLGQVRGIGCRNWRSVTGQCKSATHALERALRLMRESDKRARVLYMPTGENGSWYEPTVAMEARRT
jgi:hypothetical protein